MANFSLWATFGLCLLKLCLTETQFSVSCRYAGVFHVEKDGRYSLTRSEAVELCKALNSTLPTLEQMRRAHKLGFETCRYGFIVGHIVIPRINPYHLCAANHTGIYKLSSNTTGRYDAYCYNATETRDKACEPIERLDTSLLNNHSKIVIDNADGSRYNADGTRHSGDSSTSGVDDENVGSGSTHDTTAMDASIRRSPSTSYFENTTPVLQLPDHSSGGGEKEFPPISTDDEFSTAPTDISLVPITGDFSAKGDGQQPASTTPGPHRDNLEKATTQAQWNPFLHHWWWSNPGDKAQEPTRATRDVTSSGNGSDDEDSSEETVYPTVFPGWDVSVAKKEYSPSTTPGPHRDNLEKATTQAQWNPFLHHWWWSNPGDKAQEPTRATRAVDSQRETLQEISKQDHWNPSYTDEEEQYSSTAGRALVTSENEKREGPTQHPLLHSVHPGWISQDQSPANTAGSMEQHEFTVPGESDIEKESSHTAMASDYVAKQNDSTQDPLVYPGWDEGDDNSARPTVMDRIISSRENDHEKQSSSTAVTSPDGAHHEDPTQPPLPSDNEQGQGTAGVTHATNTPRDEVLHGLNPDVTESTTDVVHQEEATKEPLAPGTQRGSESEQATTTDGSHVNFIPGLFPDAEDHLNRLHTPPPTTVTSPDGAHHEDPTQPPLPSDNEQGQGTAGVTHATNTPRDEVLHGLNPDVTESTTDVVHQEEATKEPLAPGTQRGSESEQATTTDGSHVNFIPGLFPDAEDHLNRLHTPPPTTVTSPDGAHHEDPTQPPLPSDNEQGQGTAGVTHATNTPRDEVLHGLNPDVTESTTDVVHQEEATKEPLAPGTQRGSESEQATTTDGSHVNFIPGLFPDAEDHLNRLHTPPPTTVTSPDGAHHEDPTQPPLPSDNEQGQGTAGVTHATNTPRDEVLHGLNPDVTESTTDVVHQEEATKEPLAPGTQRGSESEQATTTDGSHVNFIPGLFPDAEDHLNRLHTPPPTTVTSPDGAHHEDPTQPPLPSDNEQGQGTAGVTHATNTPRDEVLHGLNPDVTESTTDVVHQEEATKEPLAPGTQRGSESEQATTTDGSHVNFIPGLFPDAEDHLNRLHTPPPTRSTSSIYGNKGPHMGDHESTPFPGHTTPTIISQQRSSHVPEWLIIVAALVALALILAVCIAVNSRRRCGQKKKLVINNGKGAVEDRKTGGLNGEASKSQEMVHLVHKEQSNDRTGACDEFLTLDETQNHQELDMKSGV
nr:PREDICTED: CD44 antigen isoform X7 [Apteryx mantelli mantelli]